MNLFCQMSYTGVVMLLTVAYKRRLWWLVGCLFVPILFIILLFVETKAAIRPVAIALAGVLMECMGAELAGVEWP